MDRIIIIMDGIPIKVTHVMPGFISTEMIAKKRFTPFAVSPEKAAKKIFNGMERNKAEIKFPIIMAFAAHILSLLPGWVVSCITGRLLDK